MRKLRGVKLDSWLVVLSVFGLVRSNDLSVHLPVSRHVAYRDSTSPVSAFIRG
jgi:hypothetical protein